MFFRDNRVAGIVAMVALAITIILSLLEIVTYVTFSNWMYMHSYTATADALSDSLGSHSFLGNWSILTTLLLAAGFINWIYRVHRNVYDSEVIPQKYSPGWSIGSWFIPVISFFVPYQIIKQQYAGLIKMLDNSGQRANDKTRSTMLIDAWWFTWMASIAIIIIAFIVLFAKSSTTWEGIYFQDNVIDERDNFNSFLTWSGIASGVSIIAALLGIFMINKFIKLEPIAYEAYNVEKPDEDKLIESLVDNS